jgi:hypothetical protein
MRRGALISILKTAVKIVLACFVILIFLFLWHGEAFLIVDTGDNWSNIDAVVVLAGAPDDDSLRIKKAVEITDTRGVHYLILPLRNSGITWSWLVDYYGIETPVSDKCVLIGNTEPDDSHIFKSYGGTFLEAKKTITIMLRHHLHSAIVVRPGYHLRRARMTFERARNGRPIQLHYCAAGTPFKDGRPWWTHPGYMVRVVQEYGKLIAAHVVL